MMETTKPLPTLKSSPSDGSRPLTKQEIESLRQNKQETHQWAQKELQKMKTYR